MKMIGTRVTSHVPATRLKGRVAGLVASMFCLIAAVPLAAQAPPPPTPRPDPVVRDGLPVLGSFRDEVGNQSGRGGSITQVEHAFVPTRDTTQSMQSYGEMLKVARCIAGRVGNQVEKTLAQMPGSASESRQYARIYSVMDSCGRQQTAILSLQRGAWSEALYLKARRDSLAPSDPTPAFAAFATAETPWNHNRDNSDQVMIGATNCMVAANFSVADALLRSEHGSAREAILMDRLFASSPQCAGPVRPANLSRSFLRAFVADSLYRAAEGDNRLSVFAD